MELSNDWIVGFVDGEGCFHVSILKHADMKMGYQVLPELTVVQHKRDIQILYALKRFFRCGVVRQNHDDRWCYRIRKLDHLINVCAFFDRHPLKTKKKIDFVQFRRVVQKMKTKEHLTHVGIKNIVDIALNMNTGNRNKLLEIKKDLRAK
jgi:hypothetical protein